MLPSRIYHLDGLFLKGRSDLAREIKQRPRTTSPSQSLLQQLIQVALQPMQQSQNDLSRQLQDTQSQLLSLQVDHRTLQQDNKAVHYELQRVTEGYQVLWSAYKEQETTIQSLQSPLISSWQGGPSQASIDQPQNGALFDPYFHPLSPDPSQKTPSESYYASAEPTTPNQQHNRHPSPVASTIIAQPTCSSEAGTYPHPSPALYDQSISPQEYWLSSPAPAVHVPPNDGSVDPSHINNAIVPYPQQGYGSQQPISNPVTISNQYDGPSDQISRSYGAVAVPPSIHGGQPRQGIIFNMFGSPPGGYFAYLLS